MELYITYITNYNHKMQIIIVGAGQVGSSLAADLVIEHQVTVVDIDAQRLHELQTHYDLRTVQGYGAHPPVLTEAGASSADMIIAVTMDDEVNIVACFVAATVFQIPLKIARVRTADYFTNTGRFFGHDHHVIDIFINPTTLMTHTIQHLLTYPGALRVFDFANNQVKLVATKPQAGGRLVGKYPKNMQEYLPGHTAKIVALYRHGVTMPLETTTIELGDDVLFIAANAQIHAVLNQLRPPTAISKHNRIMIIGGGHIGSELARSLETHHSVKLIEQNRKRCEQLAQQLGHTLILNGNGCDSQLLRDENIENIDYFCALTNNDADNIISALHSKQLGAKQAIALVNQDAYFSLIISGYANIDIVALSPQQITISTVLKHLRRGNIVHAYALRRGTAEALEILIHHNAPAVGCTLAQLALPPSLQIISIVRDHALMAVDEAIVIQPGDHVVLFISDKNQISAAEKWFSAKGAA
jgi:trk/ktr system potassium uptake protein